jgi:arylsulfatase
VVGKSPRVTGKAGGLSLEPAAFSQSEMERGEPLRRALKNASVLLIVLDAARARELGCYGYGRQTTPVIDALASEGALFERAHTPATYTLGAMSSLWTSLYPETHHLGVPFSGVLPDVHRTLTEILSQHGIATFGAVANAMAGRAMGLDRGFQELREIYGDPKLGSRAEFFRSHAEALFTGRRGRFFAFLHFREPHFPYDPPPPFNTQFGPDSPLSLAQKTKTDWYEAVNAGKLRPTPAEAADLVRLYDGNLAYVDYEIGLLRAFLERQGLWDRLLVIVTGDHGEELCERGHIGHGIQVYEETAHIPLVMRLPKGVSPRGVRLRGLVDLLDLAPTIADVFGIEGEGEHDTLPFRGHSLLPVILGAPGKAAALTRSVWEKPIWALSDGRHKLIYDTRTGFEQLFDLQVDPREERNIADQEPVLRAFLRQSLLAWVARQRVGAARPRPSAAPVMTRQQCENLCSLGYVACGECDKLP